MQIRPITRERVAFAFATTYLWLEMVLFGAIVFETLVVYPNIFHDVPASLDTAMEFMAVAGPHDFFPPFGMAALTLGVVSVVLAWRVESVRYWLLASVVLFLAGEFLLSVFYFWPRNAVMFEEGTAVHSAAFLRRTAREFQTGHWLRVGTNAVAAVLAFVGVARFHERRISRREQTRSE